MSLAAFFIFGLVLCVLLNLLVIMVLLRKGRDICYMDLLMISLSTSDLLQASIGCSVELHYYHTGKPISDTSCQIAGFSVTFLGLVSIAHLVGIAVERYVVLRYPIRMRLFVTHTTFSLYVIIPSWIYGFLWALFPLIRWNRYARVSGADHTCCLDMESTDLKHTSYTYNLLIWCFFLPVLVIAYCSYHICDSLRKMKTTSVILKMKQRTVDSRKKMERQQSITCLVIIGAFLFAWSPYACCVLILTARGSLSNTLLTISSVFAKTSTLYNPIIYSVFVEDFRVRCKKLFGCAWEPQLLTVQNEPNLWDTSTDKGGIEMEDKVEDKVEDKMSDDIVGDEQESEVKENVADKSLTVIVVLKNILIESDVDNI